jgi:predicted  nucleic acid-binding Zn-ribbon protein
MDKETLEYLDQKWFGLATKDDIEKLRQETKAGFRPIPPALEDVKEGLRKLQTETQSTLDQTNLKVESLLQQTREETGVAFDQANKGMNSLLQTVLQEERQSFTSAAGETQKEIEHLNAGVGKIDEQIRRLIEEMTTLSGTIRGGFKEIKEELGAMIKFSSADLEKKIHALETRIKALEKIVFP